jgi:hypothetical protein
LIRLLLSRWAVVVAIAVAGAYFSNSDAQAKRARTNEEICLAKMNANNWSMAEYRNCKAELDAHQGAAVMSGGCAKGACLYRLNKAGPRLYRGSGFVLRLTPFDAPGGMIRATLADPSGASTRFEHGCGATGCPGMAEWAGGAHRGATYQEVGDPTNPSYVLLRIPR